MQVAEGTLTPAGQRLLEAAGDLFYRRGINSVGVAAVAEAAGVTKKTLYECFGSKDNLVAAYLRARHDRWWQHLEQCLAGATAPRVLAVFDAQDHPSLQTARGCAFLNGAAELPADHPAVAVIRAHKQALRERMEDLLVQDHPHVRNPGRLAEHLYLLVEGALSQVALESDVSPLGRARDIAAGLLPPTDD
jgi:AcrR family transcriptional regulator